MDKPIRFEAGSKLTEEEKKEIYRELKDSYKVNQRPYTEENDKIVWLDDASDYMTKSDITGRLLRWYIYLPDGRIAHPTEVFGASISVSEIDRVQKNIEYHERQADLRYNELVKILKEKNEIGKVVEGINLAIENGAKLKKQFDSNDIGQKNAFVRLIFNNGIDRSVPEYLINKGDTYLGIDEQELIRIRVEGLKNKYLNHILSEIDWERFYNEFNITQPKEMETEIKIGLELYIDLYEEKQRIVDIRNGKVYTLSVNKPDNYPSKQIYDLDEIKEALKKQDYFIIQNKTRDDFDKQQQDKEQQENLKNIELKKSMQSLNGFADNQTPLRKASIEKALSKRKDFIENEVKKGSTVYVTNEVDSAKTKELQREYDYLRRVAPFGNENHPQTKRLLEIKQIEKNLGSVKVLEEKYYFKINDTTLIALNKTEKDYAQYLIDNNIFNQAKDMETEKPKIGNVFGDLVLDRLEKAYKQRFPNDKFEREALIKSWNETKNERGIDRANSNLAGIYMSYFDDSIRSTIYSDIIKQAQELEKGIAVEQEHLKTFEKVAAGDITPEQAIVETAQEHIAENPNYYDELEKIEKPKIETMEQTKLGSDDWAKIPAQNKYATPVKSKAYQYSPYDKTLQDITDNFVGSDSLRPVFSGVMFGDRGIAVTDAAKLLYINHISDKYNGVYCVTPKCKKTVGEYSIKNDKIDSKYPQYENIISSTSEFVYEVDLLALKTYCEIVIRSGFTNKVTNQIILTFDDKTLIGVNGKFLIDAIESFLIMGHRKVKVGISASSRAILFIADNDYNGNESPIGKSDFFLIMPLIITNMSKVFDFSVMQGDIDFDNLLNIAYSLEKDAVITKGGEVFHKIDTSITKKDIKDAGELSVEQLQIASSFIKASKVILPILENVKIENNTFYLTNLEQSYSISDVKMPDGIYEIRGTALFPTKYEIDEFPKMPSDFRKIGEINRQELIKNFEHCLDFVGNDGLRPIMSGVNLYKDSYDSLVIQGTDAHAVFRNEIKNSNIEEKFNIIISKPKLIYKVLESFDCDEVDFYLQDRFGYFECGKGKVYFDLIDGKYPNVEAIFPQSYDKKIILESKELKKLESEIKKLAKTTDYKVDEINAMFKFTDAGTANYTLIGNKGYGSEKKDYQELQSGSISCKVKDDYSSLGNTYKTLVMPIIESPFDLGFKTFNLSRLASLGFENIELGYTKPERAVIVLNEVNLAGVKKVAKQKKKEVKKKAIIDVENETANIINEAFNEWNSISNKSEHDKWSNKISALRFGTYKNQDILDVIVKFEPQYPNEVKKKDFITELYKALKIELPESLKPKMKFKPVIEDSEEVKEWKEAIDNLNMLLEIGGTDSETSEWNEAIENLNMLIEMETPKMAIGGNIPYDLKVTGIYTFKTNSGKEYKFAITNFERENDTEWAFYFSDWNRDKNNGLRSVIVKYSAIRKMAKGETVTATTTSGEKGKLTRVADSFMGMPKMAKGGYLENENALMVSNNNKQIAHHTEEMAEALKKSKHIPAWVVAKVNRSASDLSDATHYLEGAEGIFAKGGEMNESHYDMEKEIMESQFGKSI
jgi:DNA polymerase III sliding clamp (beta) subunit (PCNA family)/ribosomal protein L39E